MAEPVKFFAAAVSYAFEYKVDPRSSNMTIGDPRSIALPTTMADRLPFGIKPE